ncbi:MAG: alpha-(1-_3)-arabinofuranosyltransferase family protein [Ilumatobacter sp.]
MDQLRRFQLSISIAVLALVAYVPALTASPGRMPTDSKLYVYLNPGRFLADATTSFDPRQFAGWVPHQHIAYLWPTGPWFWTFETLGVPDWIAHRLWIGTLLVAAGLGMRFLARTLGFAPLAALVAALVYQLSPYVLPYISRTSVLLLPWAGLGWIVAFTVLATRRSGWRYPAAIALVVFTVGAVNATALAMVIPAPALWLIHSLWGRTASWRTVLAVAARTGVLCIGVSLWWIVMLLIQGANGADVLAFSESLEAVSFTSTSTEVTRGLGYWLFYVRDAYAATTTASIDHLVSGRTILAGWIVTLIGFAGVAVGRWEHRRFAGLLIGAGIVLGVGVHPIDDPSPLMSLLVGDGEGGLALALRSSTRAVPVLLIGLALGTAHVVSGVRLPGPIAPRTVRVATAGAIGAVAVIALPALRNGGFVDEALERDQEPPAAWLDAANDLDQRPDGYRVLQVPGTEFGAFQWGYTVDQPLPALTERPLVTRDLLPLGSPAAMDLVFALDDRVQTDTIEPVAVEAVSRLLGVDTIWISGDISYDRFRLARPEVVTNELSGLDSTSFGGSVVMGSAIPMVDNRTLGDARIGQAIAPVTLADVGNPIPTERVKDEIVVLAGSGDGIIDAAAAGVIDGSELILYAASVDEDTPLEDGYRLVITDSNRDRAHHWRSSQDVTGFTESADVASDVLRFESGDQRLDVFSSGGVDDPDDQTVSVQLGAVTAEASSYGERFAYLPEHRPAMAIDGDRDTAWLVADRAPAIGEFIRLEFDAEVEYLDLLQPVVDPGERTITRVSVVADGGEPIEVDLDDSSRSGDGQRIDIDITQTATVTITATTTPQPPIGEAIGGVGFIEIGTGSAGTTEFIRTPLVSAAQQEAAGGIDVVLTRLRVEPLDRWRDDPEPLLARQFELADATVVEPTVTLRLDRRLPSAVLASLLGETAVASAHLTGAPQHRGAAAVDGELDTAWITPFDDVRGQSLTWSGNGTATTMTVAQPDGDHFSPAVALRVTDASGSFDVVIPERLESTVTLPREVDLKDVTIEIVDIDERMIQNRRFNEPTLLPAAISEITFDGQSPAVRPQERLTAECRDDLLLVDGVGVALSFDVSTDDAIAGSAIATTPCTPSIDVAAGTHRVLGATSARSGFDVDRVVLSTPSASTPSGDAVDPTQPITVSSSSRLRTLEVPACPSGCWVVHGEGYNAAWNATANGVDLGEPTLVDGNANGWWLAPTTEPTAVEVTWPVQRQLNVAFLLSLLAVAGCVALALRRRSAASNAPSLEEDSIAPQPGDGVHTWIVVAAATLASAVLIDWVWALPTAIVAGTALLVRRPAIVAWCGVGIVAVPAAVMIVVVRTDAPFPDAGWPLRLEWLHPWTLLGVMFVVTAACLDAPERRRDPA